MRRRRERRCAGRPGRVAWATILLASIVGVAGLGGCQKVLFPKDAPRSQFESYDTLRQRYTPLEAPDVFGRPRPALRARLTPST
jgi:hypothetical protein